MEHGTSCVISFEKHFPKQKIKTSKFKISCSFLSVQMVVIKPAFPLSFQADKQVGKEYPIKIEEYATKLY